MPDICQSLLITFSRFGNMTLPLVSEFYSTLNACHAIAQQREMGRSRLRGESAENSHFFARSRNVHSADCVMFATDTMSLNLNVHIIS